MSLDMILVEIEECRNLGTEKFILFPKINDELKDKEATYALTEDNY